MSTYNESTPFRQFKRTPTPRLSERKKSLFQPSNPKDESNDSSLGRMSPLVYNENSNQSVSDNDILKTPIKIIKSKLLSSPSLLSGIEETDTLADFLIDEHSSESDKNVARIENISLSSNMAKKCAPNLSEVFNCIINSQKTSDYNLDHSSAVTPSMYSSIINDSTIIEMSTPEKGLPCFENSENLDISNSSREEFVIIPETPLKESPTNALKTPYETLNSDLELPRLVNRKSLCEISNENICVANGNKSDDLDNSHRKSLLDIFNNSVSETCEDNKENTDYKSVISTKTFYSKNTEDSSFNRKKLYNLNSFNVSNNSNNKKKSTKKSPSDKIFLCGFKGGSRKRKSFGEINAGVWHGIKKTKPKSKSTTKLNKTLKSDLLNKSLPAPSLSNDQENDSVIPQLEKEQIDEMDNLMKELKNNNSKTDCSTIDDPLLELDPLKIQVKSTNKRPLSPDPESQKDEKPKKFFKSCRDNKRHSYVVNFNDDQAKKDYKDFMRKKRNTVVRKQVQEEKLIDDKKVDNILKILEDKDIISAGNDQTLPNSSLNPLLQTTQQNGIHSPSHIYRQNALISQSVPNNFLNSPSHTLNANHTKPINLNDFLISPTSQMCNMTSDLALTSPKQVTAIQNLTEQLNNIPSNENSCSSDQQLYPLFLKGKVAELQKQTTLAKLRSAEKKKSWRFLKDDQYQLDAGQKRWGPTQCPQCEFVYQQNEPEDEQKHYDFHNSVRKLKFTGWKSEKVVGVVDDARIVLVGPKDPKIWWKKVEDVLTVVDRSLGIPLDDGTADSKVFLYVFKNKIVGLLQVENICFAHRRVVDVNTVYKQQVPVHVGVLRLWVCDMYRNDNIHGTLLDVLRRNHTIGHLMSVDDIAFNDPTETEIEYIEDYLKRQDFLVYSKFQ